MTTFTANPISILVGKPNHFAVGSWLLVICVMVLLMVMIGGVTRLTHSGLSMVVWEPITSWLPPLTTDEWQKIFLNYKETPEFKKINYGMDLNDFKSIFWLEYVHRLWGRIIGIAFLLPFFYFLLRGWISRSLASKLIFIFILGMAQGVLGWFMVQSGLSDRPDVSQYRLTAHLAVAIILYAYLFWIALGQLHDQTMEKPIISLKFRRLGVANFLWLFFTMLAGGLVAGLDAGFTYNTFPLMDGKLIPDGLFENSPVYINFFENIITVQFGHRLMAIVSVVLVASLWWQARREIASIPDLWPFHVLITTVILQFALGVATLLLVVPIHLAAAHQLGAFLSLTACLWALDRLVYRRKIDK
ncbi:COX15/CtaA family protein [Rhodospirillales bacterium]|nr:COX15/CtaA family protein [Rhodospirillales bacterium]